METKKKKIIIIVSLIVALILIASVIVALVVRNQTIAAKKDDKVYLVIERLDEKGEHHLYRQLTFTKDLTYHEVILSLKETDGTNEVVIEDGICFVKEASCPLHNCMYTKIQLDIDFFNNPTIQCRHNGLYIYLTNELVGA